MRENFPDLNELGEGMRQVSGRTTSDMVCDGCGEELPVGRLASAVSIYSSSNPYFEWEDNFIRIDFAAAGKTVTS